MAKVKVGDFVVLKKRWKEKADQKYAERKMCKMRGIGVSHCGNGESLERYFKNAGIETGDILLIEREDSDGDVCVRSVKSKCGIVFVYPECLKKVKGYK